MPEILHESCFYSSAKKKKKERKQAKYMKNKFITIYCRSLPEGTLFDENSVSTVWLEVVERASKFLRSVVKG